jgi:parallel beta-helix repeat protein
MFNILINVDSCYAKENNFFYVGGIGNGNYTNIQDAIDESRNDDTIFVYNGIYNENLVINKSINLVGSDKNSTIIRGNNSLYIIFVKSSWVNITGFTIKSGKMGIYVSGINYSFNNISDNIITNNWDGIRFYRSSNNKITNNIITNHKNLGIVFEESKNNLIKNNKFFDDNKAIVLNRWSDYNLILNNNLTDNLIGISLFSSYKNLINNNYISNCTNGVYLSYSTNNTIAENIIDSNYKYGIYLTNSDPNEYSLNYFSNNYQDVKTGPEPPKIKAPGFDLIIIVFSLFFILFLRKKIK